MAKLSGLSRLLRAKVKSFKRSTKSLSGAAKMITVGAVGGATAGLVGSPSGLKGAGAQEGAFVGGTLAAAATIGTKIVFRRIRGRIIPIRVKAN